MMIKNSFFLKKISIFIIYFFLNFCVFAATSTQTEWIVAAQKFTYKNNVQSSSFSDSILTNLPCSILEKIDLNILRNISNSEIYSREQAELKKERISLFLQLSNAIKKRDALVLQNYSDKELKNKIKEEEKKVDEIKEKIDENIQKQKEIEEKSLGIYQEEEKNFLEKYSQAFSDFLKQNQDEEIYEKISIYNKDSSVLYKFSDENILIDDPKAEQQILNSKINALITGQITAFGEYLSVTVEVYLFPGAKKIGTVTEVGTVQELELFASSIAEQIIPILTNSMPVTLKINLENDEQRKNATLYINDTTYETIPEEIVLASGVYNLTFVCPGFKTLGTSYFFEGGKTFKIDVNMQKEQLSDITLNLKKPMIGSYLVNGISIPSEEGIASIKVNEKNILGEFLAENGEYSFFYIPEKNILPDVTFQVKTNFLDKSDYIEKHRRRMYNAYSVLIVSLIPYFYTKGNLDYYTTENNLAKIQTWQTANKVSGGISIAAGTYFVYELVRYFIAADSVLPKNAKIIK